MAKIFASHRPKPARGQPSADRRAAPAAGAAPGKGKPPPAPAPESRAEGAPKEIGGPSGPEPTRYGDWERKGICVDF